MTSSHVDIIDARKKFSHGALRKLKETSKTWPLLYVHGVPNCPLRVGFLRPPKKTGPVEAAASVNQKMYQAPAETKEYVLYQDSIRDSKPFLD